MPVEYTGGIVTRGEVKTGFKGRGESRNRGIGGRDRRIHRSTQVWALCLVITFTSRTIITEEPVYDQLVNIGSLAVLPYRA